MRYTAKKLLEIAVAEIGYKEKETNAQLDNPTANAGDENYTKYARDLAAAGYYQADKQGYAWCDMFVDHCFLQLCGTRAKAEEITCQTGPYGAGCVWSANYYKAQGRFHTSDPKPGDQIFFNNYAHTGIVEKVENGVITTIEGNTSNRVARRTYPVRSNRIDGYGRPKYDVENPVEPVERPEPPAETCDLSLPMLRRDSEGETVRAMQILLIGNGYPCPVWGADGEFGNETGSALQDFQREHDLVEDEICGSKTWAKLLGV